MGNQVFLSYARKDSDFVQSIANKLKQHGCIIWIDKDILAGTPWAENIETAIQQCSDFLVVLSPEAVGSENVKDEIHIAREAGKNIIPIDYRPCKHPLRINRLQTVDWTSGDPQDGAAFERLFSALSQVDSEEPVPNSLADCQTQILGLLNSQLELLERLLHAPELLKSKSGGRSSLDREKAEGWKGELETEQKKVAQFEMVLTVVGTMNAGKSTTINAIVGTEILPRHYMPMTSLPTRVCHKQGLKVPRLTIQKLAPIKGLRSQLRAKLRELKRDEQLEKLVLYGEPECLRAINTLLTPEGGAEEISKTYEGFADIYAFLAQLNSWVRLARDPEIKVGLPLDSFVEIDELPVIEVEFSHLKSMSFSSQGIFTLLDTPGRGEYSQSSALQKIFEEQLRRSSAVLTVVDCLALKGQTETIIRKELVAISSQVGDRLFVLVNKFDAIQDEPDANAEKLSQYVSEQLMSELQVSSDRVHVVSGLNAFLSRRVLRELEDTGTLLGSSEDHWVQEFGKKTLGLGWKHRIARLEEVRQAAEELWTSSGFEPLIEDVIKSTARALPMLSLKAALDKMQSFDTEISAFLRLRKRGMTGSQARVQKDIDQMQAQIEVIESEMKKANEEIDQAAEQISQKVNNIRHRKKESLTTVVEDLFSSGMKKFSSKGKGQKHVDAGMSILEERYEKIVAGVENEVGRECQKIYSNLANHIKGLARKVAAATEGDLGDLDLRISQEAPVIELTSGRLRRPTVRMREETREKERRVPKTSGLFGGDFARWAGEKLGEPDWGYERRTTDVTTYELNENMVKQKVIESVDQRLKELGDEAQQQVKKAFGSYRKVLGETAKQLKDYRGDLQRGLESKEMKSDELDKLVGVVGTSLLFCQKHLERVQRIRKLWIERISIVS